MLMNIKKSFRLNERTSVGLSGRSASRRRSRRDPFSRIRAKRPHPTVYMYQSGGPPDGGLGGDTVQVGTCLGEDATDKRTGGDSSGGACEAARPLLVEAPSSVAAAASALGQPVWLPTLPGTFGERLARVCLRTCVRRALLVAALRQLGRTAGRSVWPGVPAAVSDDETDKDAVDVHSCGGSTGPR
eukprot:scaffold7392_cov388-Prasinococcus_capsulatus_cf.AAC.3